MENREREAFNFFRGKGWTSAQAAGIVSNLVAESGLNPGIAGDAGHKAKTSSGSYTVGSHGIAQWNGDRLMRLKSKYGDKWNDFRNQLEFVQWELENTHKTAGQMLKKTKTAAEAADVVVRRYEIPKDLDGESKKRQGLTKGIMDRHESSEYKYENPFKLPVNPLDKYNFHKGQPSKELTGSGGTAFTMFGDYDEEEDEEQFNEDFDNFLDEAVASNREESVSTETPWSFGEEESTEGTEEEEDTEAVAEVPQEEEEDIDFEEYYNGVMDRLDGEIERKKQMAAGILNTFSDFDEEGDPEEEEGYYVQRGGQIGYSTYLETIPKGRREFLEEMGEEFSENDYSMYNLIASLNEA